MEQRDLGTLKDILTNYKSKIVGECLKSNSHPRIFQMKRQSYKLTEDGRYSNLAIDLNQLYGFNKLVVSKDSEIVINQNVDDDFIELITKRYNSKKTY